MYMIGFLRLSADGWISLLFSELLKYGLLTGFCGMFDSHVGELEDVFVVEELEESNFAKGGDGELQSVRTRLICKVRVDASYAVFFVMHDDLLERVDAVCPS